MKSIADSVRNTFRMMFWSWRFIYDWRICFILCSVLSIMQNAWMSVTSAYLIGQTMAHAASGEYIAMLRTAGIVAGVAGSGIILITGVNYYISRINILGLAHLRKTLFAKLTAMPTSEANKKLSGDLSTRMSMDAERTASFFSSMMMGDRSIFAIPVSILICSVICIIKLPVIGILNLLFLIVSIYINLVCIRHEYVSNSRYMSGISILVQRMVDVISGCITVRMFGLTAHLQREYGKDSDTVYFHAKQGARYNAMRSSLSSAIQWGAIIFTLIAGGLLVHTGAADLGTVVFVVLLQSQINNDVLLMTNSYHQLQYATIAATRVREILDCADECMRCNTVSPDMEGENALVMQNITLSYEKDNPVIADLSLSLKNGESLAIVGSSGGGKTTLIRYIMEFAQAECGTLQLYGKLREGYSQEAVRKLIAYVPQDCYIFEGTIRENILCGNMDASEEKLQNAIVDAGLRELIDNLPGGLNTPVGERGAQLSGGQRQRIAIARAIIKNAPLLLLDEATSALDGEAEVAIQQALERLMQGHTSIVIAHRLSTVRNCDRIIVMEQGAIVEEGTHDDLMKRSGRYAKLYQLQYV